MQSPSCSTAAQQGVHWTLGILRNLQAFFYASAFSGLESESTPAPAPVTQTVRQPIMENEVV